MDKNSIIETVRTYISSNPMNLVPPEQALRPDLAGSPMYDEPLVMFGDAHDPYFEQFKNPEIIGPHFISPTTWLPGASTVISIFLPLRPEVRKDNAQDMQLPSKAWLNARIEGQAMIGQLNLHVQSFLQAAGYEAMAPLWDKRLKVWEKLSKTPEEPSFSSNWSERHAAFVCGLGTFGLSKGLITERGVAGRFTSIITSLYLPRDTRAYTRLYEYCSMCGACIKNCPAGAISFEHGKDHIRCGAFIDETRTMFAPRYGCGKCQVKVPCEARACGKGMRRKPA